MDRLRFRSLASGSSGNCYYIGNASYGILIDAGVGVRTIHRFLKSMGMDFHHIWGVLVTHDHVDHIKAIGVVGEKYHVPVYATRKIHDGINRSYCVTQKLSSSQRVIEIGETVTIGGFTISAFPVSHDASECVGYSLEYQGKTFTIATDLGYVNNEAARYLTQSDYIILEANYDETMLDNGSYPPHLKDRIKANTGHLSNTQAASFLAEHFTDRWRYVFLCHLIKDNNHPDLAYATIAERLRAQKIDIGNKVEITPLERMSQSQLYIFD